MYQTDVAAKAPLKSKNLPKLGIDIAKAPVNSTYKVLTI